MFRYDTELTFPMEVDEVSNDGRNLLCFIHMTKGSSKILLRGIPLVLQHILLSPIKQLNT